MTVEARQGKASEGKRSNLYISVFHPGFMKWHFGVIMVKKLVNFQGFWGHSGAILERSGAFWEGTRMTAREGPWGRKGRGHHSDNFFLKCVNDGRGKARQGE